MAKHVCEGDAEDGHIEFIGPSEVGLRGLARTMLLCEKRHLFWALQSTPRLHETLHGAQLAILVGTRIARA